MLDHEIKAIQERLNEYQAMYQVYSKQLEEQENRRAYFLSILTLEYGLLAEHFLNDWLHNVKERILAEGYSLHDPPNVKDSPSGKISK